MVSDETAVRQLIQVTWDMTAEVDVGRKTRTREINGLLAAAESLDCDRLTVITHDEDACIEERGYRIQVVPAWTWLLNRTGEMV